jgi:hypothetical protein
MKDIALASREGQTFPGRFFLRAVSLIFENWSVKKKRAGQ